MDKWVWIIVIVGSIISIAGSVFIVVYVLKRKQVHDAESGIGKPRAGSSQGKAKQGKKWNRIMLSYLFMCFIIAAIILYQSIQGMNERAIDIAGVLVGAFFFYIQAFSSKNTAVRRELATVYTTAAFIKLEAVATADSGRLSYNSILKFTVQETVHRIRYRGNLNKEEGAKVELYYDPEDPDRVYVPELEKSKSRFLPAFLLFFGVLSPLASLVSPLFS